MVTSLDRVIELVCREVHTIDGDKCTTEVGSCERRDTGNTAFNGKLKRSFVNTTDISRNKLNVIDTALSTWEFDRDSLCRRVNSLYVEWACNSWVVRLYEHG